MDIFLSVLALILLLVGLAGSVIPALPGPPLSYAGLLTLHFTRFGETSARFLLLWAMVTVGVTLADLYLPGRMARRYGGSRSASIGAWIGMVAGFFIFPPLGIIFCPFVGAFTGELFHDHANNAKALKAAFGTFAAWLIGTGLKLITCGVMLFCGIRAFFT